MPLCDIEQLLKNRMGLHSATVGSGTILHAVEQRMRDRGITEIADYRKVLSNSGTELGALIDAVVISETWFFRDINPFDAFNRWLREEWLPHHAGSTLRILSAPCSSGEEAYTLAMCLADTGILPRSARIDAVDISHINIDAACKGEYGGNSFRGNRLEYRDRHFQACGGRYLINDNNREYVRFEQTNMLDDSFSHNRSPYHVIFCRNLLIYFDRSTQDAVIDCLQALLTGNGLLFLGHSETGLLLNRELTPLPSQRCFGFRCDKNSRQDRKHPESEPSPHPRRRNHTTPHVETAPMPFSDVTSVSLGAPADECEGHHDDLLRQAFRLADEGHLGEAAEQCESLLAEQAHQADAYFLLGLIRESAGNLPEAKQLLGKAVYLDPAHHEALVHLGIVCEQLGDSANASRFRKRAARAAPRLVTGATE